MNRMKNSNGEKYSKIDDNSWVCVCAWLVVSCTSRKNSLGLFLSGCLLAPNASSLRYRCRRHRRRCRCRSQPLVHRVRFAMNKYHSLFMQKFHYSPRNEYDAVDRRIRSQYNKNLTHSSYHRASLCLCVVEIKRNNVEHLRKLIQSMKVACIDARHCTHVYSEVDGDGVVAVVVVAFFILVVLCACEKWYFITDTQILAADTQPIAIITSSFHGALVELRRSHRESTSGETRKILITVLHEPITITNEME